MKCKYCNSKIKESDIFCPECGKKTKESVILKWFRNNGKLLCIIASIIIILVILFSIVCYLVGPKHLASKYIKAVMNNDYEEIYKLADLKDSDLVSVKTLRQKIYDYKADEYKFDGIETNGDITLVRYIYSQNNKKYYVYVELVKQLNKKLLVFDNYKIVSGKVATDVTLEIPKNSKITLDKKDIKSYLDESTDSYDIYLIDKMIKGTYDVEITLPNGTVVSDKLDIESDQVYNIGNFDIDDTLKATLIDKVNNTLYSLYTNAISNTEYNNTGLNNLKEEYKELRSYIQIKNSLYNISFNDIDVETATYNDNLVVSFSAGCNYTLNDSTTGMGYINIDVEFTYNDGNYEIKSIYNLPMNFR